MSELHSLTEAVAHADAIDGLLIDVTLLAGGWQVSGRLISEVRYRQSITDTVRSGNAAGLASSFDRLTEYASQKRNENQRRRKAGAPHASPPETPKYVHLAEVNIDGDQRTWCLPISAVDAWSLDAFGFDPDHPQPLE
ncbi:hypothetical protein [Streptomyces sp. NPDC057428]|uniref:hypothetical protein n=1 Tax=Streptomyces sp. NPDC057428 TaxID=3346129 RepID=UPI00368BB692